MIAVVVVVVVVVMVMDKRGGGSEGSGPGLISVINNIPALIPPSPTVFTLVIGE